VSLYDDDEDEPSHKEIPAMTVIQQLRRLKEWLGLCDDRTSVGRREGDVHNECHTEDCLTIPAKRVLDLTDAATIRIIDTINIEGRYIALSYCWGSTQRHPLMTTHATLEDHLFGVALSSLPQSFHNATTVSRYLRVQYIWLDCLCIVQDDRYGPSPQRRCVLILS
jgi:hypothetical protein